MKKIPVPDCGGSLNNAPPAPPAPQPEAACAFVGEFSNQDAAPVQLLEEPLADEMKMEKAMPAKEYPEADSPDHFLEWVKKQPKPTLPPTTERKADGTFKKSGNPRGRPRKKERAFVTRQHTRDVLAVTEELIPVQTPNGPVKLPAIMLALMKVRSKALAGHGPSLRSMIAMHLEALQDHEARHKFFSHLEELERFSVLDPEKLGPSLAVDANEKRKGTRET